MRVCLSHLFLFTFLSHLSWVFSITAPSHGCFWTQTCESKWLGGCGMGNVIVDQSDDCHGLCPVSKYSPCLPFHTHFRCCKPERPKVTNKCAKCENKIDFGDEFICCTDCSDPYVTDKSTKLGYCKTVAELAVQTKPREIFKWIPGPWMECSSPCDGGIRYRDLSCFGSIENAPSAQYLVPDKMCLNVEMPVKQETCNVYSCDNLVEDGENIYEAGGMSGWLVALIFLLGLFAMGGIGFAGYTCYRRRTSSQSGFVYIMLPGYA